MAQTRGRSTCPRAWSSTPSRTPTSSSNVRAQEGARDIFRQRLITCGGRLRGFTLIEMLAATALVTIIAAMGLTVLPAMRRSMIQARGLSRLKEFAALQESYRTLGNLALNPEGTYASFEELQLAGYIADDLAASDDVSHQGACWLPYYEVTVARDFNTLTLEPDSVGYAIIAEPIGTPGAKLPALFMEEDGEVFVIEKDGSRRVLR